MSGMRMLRLLPALLLAGVALLPVRSEGTDLEVLVSLPLVPVPDRVAVDPVARKAFVTHRMFARKLLTVLDLDRIETRTIEVREDPVDLLADAARGRVYVLHRGGFLSVVETGLERVVAEVAVGGTPHRLAADLRRGELYASGAEGGSVAVVDVSRLVLAGSLVCGPAAAGEVAVDRVRGRVYVAYCTGDSNIAVFDQGSRALVGSFAIDAGFIYCDEFYCDEFYRVSNLAVDERRGRLYALGRTGNALDLRTGTLETFDVAIVRPVEQRLSVVYDRLYLGGSYPGGDGLEAVDAVQPRAVALALASGPMLVDEDGGDVYATSITYVQGEAVPNRVLRLHPETLAIVAEHPAPMPSPHPLASPLALFRDPARPVLFFVYANRLVATAAAGARAGTRVAREYRLLAHDLFFVTADAGEARLLDDGRFDTDWLATGEAFRVWTDPGPGRVPVCRFFGAAFAPRSSHLFALDDGECETLRAGTPLHYEGVVFHLAPTDDSGSCPEGAEALYRLYNGGRGGVPGHRLTRERATRDALVGEGWQAEGAGPDTVFACAPRLR